VEPLEDRQVLDRLVHIARSYQIISILELSDESFELGVLTTYIPKLKEFLGRVFLHYSVDLDHRPFDPSVEAVIDFCKAHPELSNNHIVARSRMINLFWERVESMIREGFPVQKYWYSHLGDLIPK
jgi:hypothetical protein